MSKAVVNNNDLLTRLRYIYKWENIILIRTTSNYFWSSAVAIFDFQNQFYTSKIIWIFPLQNVISGAHFRTYFENFNFSSTLFSKNEPNFCKLRSNSNLFVSNKYFIEFIHILIVLVICHNLGHSNTQALRFVSGEVYKKVLSLTEFQVSKSIQN